MLSVIEGPPGVGKSTLAIELMRCITNGLPLPFSERQTVHRSDCMIIAPEDPVSEVIKPRLLAAGVNVSGVHHYRGLIASNQERRQFEINPNQLEALENVIKTTDFRFIYIDSVMGLLGKSDANSEQDTRGILTPLAGIAERTNAAILIGRHWSKGASMRQSHERGIGSIAWSAVCRSVLQVARDPEDHEKRIVCIGKGNLGPDQPARVFSLDPVPVEIDESETTYTKIRWLEERENFNPDSLGRAPAQGTERETTTDQAVELIMRALTANDGQMESNLLKETIVTQGISERAVNSAKSRLKKDRLIKYAKGELNEWITVLVDCHDLQSHLN